MHHDKEFLIKLKSDIIKVAKELDITINKKKTHIHKIQNGIIWLKTRYILSDTGKIYKKPYRKNIVRMRRKLKKLHCKGVSNDLIEQSYQSWLGCIKQSHSHNVIKNMNKLKGELEMIKVELLENDLKKTYSDEGFMILRVDNGALYEEAIDPIQTDREYIETDIVIERQEDVEVV